MNRTALIDRSLRWSPIQMTAKRANRGLRVLCYHGVSDPYAFRRQLDFLARHYHPVNLNAVLRAMAHEDTLPERAVLVTFDDGLPSHVDRALPELAQVGISAVFFLVLGYLGTDEPFWWDAVLGRKDVLRQFPLAGQYYSDATRLVTALKQVPDAERLDALQRLDERYGPAAKVRQLNHADAHELLARGHNVGDHSYSHPLLDKLPDDRLAQEMSASHDAFVRSFPDQPHTYAFPNGNQDDRVLGHLDRLGYEASFLFDHRIGVSGKLVSRLRVNASASVDHTATIVSGAHPAILHRLGRVS